MQKPSVGTAALCACSCVSDIATVVISNCSHCATLAITSAPKYWECLHFTSVHPFRIISVYLVKVARTCSYSLTVPFLDPCPLQTPGLWSLLHGEKSHCEGDELLLSCQTALGWIVNWWATRATTGLEITWLTEEGRTVSLSYINPAVRSLQACSQKGVTLIFYIRERTGTSLPVQPMIRSARYSQV